MPKLLPSKSIIKVLERKGFVFISQKGSHIKYRKHESVVLTVIVLANKKKFLMELSDQFLGNQN